MISFQGSDQSGFTLLELLASVVLLSIGFAVLLNGIGYATKALTRDNQTSQMALLAKSIFDERTLGVLQDGQWDGRINEIRWHLTSMPQASSSSVQLYRLELVLEEQARQERFITLRAQRRSPVLQ